MLVSMSVSLARQSVPVRAVVQAVYATVVNPFGQPDRQRVQVLSVRLVNILGQGGQPPYKVADVIGLCGCTLGYSVRVEDLKDVSAFIVEEVAS